MYVPSNLNNVPCPALPHQEGCSDFPTTICKTRAAMQNITRRVEESAIVWRSCGSMHVPIYYLKKESGSRTAGSSWT
jgi:hypothetical protein